MGKLIKNHLARLIVMTAGACKFHVFKICDNSRLIRSRSNRRSFTRFLLAKVLLGFCHNEFRLRSQASTDTSNHKPALRHTRPRMGMATQEIRRNRFTSIDRSPTSSVPTTLSGSHLDVPKHKCRAVLSDWRVHVFLGI